MTQDELLTRITIVGDTSIEQALLAVVKMHEPIWRGCDEPSCCGSEDMCRCGDYYPCDTIQAIEKEFG
jgi:hypothetical protein